MYNERKYGANKLFLDTRFIHANFSLYKNEYILYLHIYTIYWIARMNFIPQLQNFVKEILKEKLLKS